MPKSDVLIGNKKNLTHERTSLYFSLLIHHSLTNWLYNFLFIKDAMAVLFFGNNLSQSNNKIHIKIKNRLINVQNWEVKTCFKQGL